MHHCVCALSMHFIMYKLGMLDIFLSVLGSHLPLLSFYISSLCQVSRMDYKEVQRLLVEALKFRRKYMELSLQEFCDTTRRMIDNELPPSSVFCVPDTKGSKVIATPEGDILPREFGW